MFRSYKSLAYLLLIGLAGTLLLTSSCKKDDEDIVDTVVLDAFGPSPALRGGELRIIGKNLDQVTAVVLPDQIKVSTFTSQTPTLITLTIPEETVEGKIVLNHAGGMVVSLSTLTISEPIEVTGISPLAARPGDVLTIEGNYLNLIKEVIFSADQAVGDTAFVSQSKEKIEVTIPETAQTGVVTVSNAEEIPILVASEEELTVTTPAITNFSPNPVKAGATLTINGTDLDLVRQVAFQGSTPVMDFANQTATTLEVSVPADAHDGPLVVLPASLVEVISDSDLEMVVPQISGLSPNPAKNGQDVTVSGVDLDLVTRVVFGGDKEGSIQSSSISELTVTVPIDASEGTVTFHTAAEKSVASGSALSLVQPTVTGFSPVPAEIGATLMLNGTDLDVITSVIFNGEVSADATIVTPTMAEVVVPAGASSGPVRVVMANGTEVNALVDLEVALATLAVITDIPTSASIGSMISILGENLDEINELFFPGDVPATMFGQKTATLIEVFVPLGTATGLGSIKFITFAGEEFLSTEINFQGVDPVADPTLVFFTFDGLDSWWGDTGGVENEASLSLDGSNYFRVNGSLSGWTGFFWRNGGNNFPGAAIGTNISDYVLKFDLNVLDPITGGVFHWRLKGSDGDFWHRWAPWEGTGSYSTNGWVTITIPLEDFVDDFGWGTNMIPDLNNITEDFGIAFNDGDSNVNVCIDNVRFELK